MPLGLSLDRKVRDSHGSVIEEDVNTGIRIPPGAKRV